MFVATTSHAPASALYVCCSHLQWPTRWWQCNLVHGMQWPGSWHRVQRNLCSWLFWHACCNMWQQWAVGCIKRLYTRFVDEQARCGKTCAQLACPVCLTIPAGLLLCRLQSRAAACQLVAMLSGRLRAAAGRLAAAARAPVLQAFQARLLLHAATMAPGLCRALVLEVCL